MSVAIAPTPERLKKAPHVERPSINQRTKREAWRIVSPVETMYKRGQLNEECWHAFQRYERDVDRAYRYASIISRYGERAGARGTPVSQLTAEVICPEELRADAIRRVVEAEEAIGSKVMVCALKTLILKETTLEEIGRKFGGWKNKPQAIACAVTLIQQGTYKLAIHYGYLRERSKPPS